MTISNPPAREVLTQYADSPSVDAFGRGRVSTPDTLLNTKQIFDNSPLFFDDAEDSGAGTTTSFSADEAGTTIGVSAATAGVRTRQTFQRFNYQPGKSQEIFLTGVLNLTGGGSGISQRIGYFDDENGLYFENDEGTIKVARRSNATGSVVDSKIAQADWNLDKMDGSGLSQVTADFTKTQIFVIDFEWLGVGRIRFGLVIAGVLIYMHEINNANVLAVVYMSTPNLPIRYQIENDGAGGAATLLHMCSTVISEGGVEELGLARYKSTAGTHIDANAENIAYAIIAIRLQAAKLGGNVQIVDFSLFSNIANGHFEWFIVLNPTVANLSYADETNSLVQTSVGEPSNPSTSTVTGGTLITGGQVFAGTGASKGGAISGPLKTARLLGAKIDGTVDQILLCVRPIAGATNLNVEGGLTWRELS